MSVIDSERTMKAYHLPVSDKLTRANVESVFSTDLFEMYVGRLTRLHILSQFVQPSHKVYIDELRLIREARSRLQKHLVATVPSWKLPWRVCKMIITTHIRNLAELRLATHDIEDDVREAALESIYREDFEDLWPAGWLDG